jgi:hypothetical protein
VPRSLCRQSFSSRSGTRPREDASADFEETPLALDEHLELSALMDEVDAERFVGS